MLLEELRGAFTPPPQLMPQPRVATRTKLTSIEVKLSSLVPQEDAEDLLSALLEVKQSGGLEASFIIPILTNMCQDSFRALCSALHVDPEDIKREPANLHLE